jgi:hypothetical protein
VSHCLCYQKTMFYIKTKCDPSSSVERLVQKWLENHWTKKSLSFKFHGRTEDAFVKESECSLCSEIWEIKLIQDWNIKLIKPWLGIEIAIMQFRLNLHKLIAALESGQYNIMAKKVHLLDECVSVLHGYMRKSQWLIKHHCKS